MQNLRYENEQTIKFNYNGVLISANYILPPSHLSSKDENNGFEIEVNFYIQRISSSGSLTGIVFLALSETITGDYKSIKTNIAKFLSEYVAEGKLDDEIILYDQQVAWLNDMYNSYEEAIAN